MALQPVEELEFDEPTPEALAAEVIAALDDPAATADRAEAARRFAVEHCAWPGIGERMLAAYRGLPGLAG